jgi:hypothetical protein
MSKAVIAALLTGLLAAGCTHGGPGARDPGDAEKDRAAMWTVAIVGLTVIGIAIGAGTRSDWDDDCDFLDRCGNYPSGDPDPYPAPPPPAW